MADITAGLPTLRPDNGPPQNLFTFRVPGDIQQAFQNGLSYLRGPAPAGGAGPSLADLFGARANDIAGMLTPSAGAPATRAAPAAAASAAPLVTTAQPAPYTQADAAAAAGTGPTTALVQAAPTPAARTPTTGGRANASMPASAPAPLVPGETGFYMGDQLVPYGTRFLASGTGGVTQLGGGGGSGGGGVYDNLPGGGKLVGGRFADPRDALEVGFRLQTQYRNESMAEILRQAGNGGDLGFRAKIGALAQAFGGNNFGATSVGGANSLNQAIAHIAGAELGANATLGAAQAHAGATNAQTLEHAYQFDATPKAVGQTSVEDPLTHLTTNQTSYAMPAPRGSGGQPRVIDTAKPQPKPVEGSTGTLKDGRRFVIKDGEAVVAK